jgi:uncharacterized membrane protein
MDAKLCHRGVFASVVALLLGWSILAAHADTPVVHAVLFYSPNCGHCHKVITEDFPPLFERYGDSLQIIGVNTADAGGSALFEAAANKFNLASENLGVPLLVIADVVLIGSLDIPQQLPVLIEKYLAEGGVGWPELPGLAEAIAQVEAAQPTAPPPMATSRPAATLAANAAAPTHEPSVVPTATRPATSITPTPTPGIVMAASTSDGLRSRFNRDPLGNGLAIIVLAGMVIALGSVAARSPWRAWAAPFATVVPGRRRRPARAVDWAVPLLVLAGLGVAGYLAYVETQQVRAVCGPVGDCNTVQQSEYARLFGLIPIGVLGALAYLAILAAWAVYRLHPGRLGQWAGLAVRLMVAGGVLFSIYLTFLEPFVIGATCAWCLSSAIIMTLLLLLASAEIQADNAGPTPITETGPA